MEPPTLGNLDIKLGRDTFSIPITRAKNLVIELLPYSKPFKEVMAISPFEPPEASLDKDAEQFIQDEDDLGETIELPAHATPSRPPIEFRPLPAGLRYAFLNGDNKTPIIISNKLSYKETVKLIAILKKHRPIFGYSL